MIFTGKQVRFENLLIVVILAINSISIDALKRMKNPGRVIRPPPVNNHQPTFHQTVNNHYHQPSMHQPSIHQPSIHQPSIHQPSMHFPSAGSYQPIAVQPKESNGLRTSDIFKIAGANAVANVGANLLTHQLLKPSDNHPQSPTVVQQSQASPGSPAVINNYYVQPNNPNIETTGANPATNVIGNQIPQSAGAPSNVPTLQNIHNNYYPNQGPSKSGSMSTSTSVWTFLNIFALMTVALNYWQNIV